MAESAAYSRRGFKGACVASTVAAGLAAGATSATVADASTWAGLLTNGNARLMLGRLSATPEEVEISGLAGNAITISARGLQGTSDTTHAAGVTIEVIHSPRDFNEANAHIADTTLDHHTQYILKSLYDANSILIATSDNTPIVKAVAASTFLGRKSTGAIDDMTAAEAKTVLALVAADITDLGVWTSYTPTWSGTLGNGTLVARYTQIGKTVHFYIKLTWGSTTSHPAAAQTFTFPVTAGTTGGFIGLARLLGHPATVAVTVVVSSTLMQVWDSSHVAITAAAPTTWVNTDAVEIHGSYEAA